MSLYLATAGGGGGGSGTVTSVSVVSANGLAGTVATATTTPAITLSTSITGVLKGNGTAISAAAAGTDYQAPITLTTTGNSGAATFAANTLNIPNYFGTAPPIINTIRVITASGAVTVSATTDYIISLNKTVGAATTVNLPATPATGLTYIIKDIKGDANVNNITVTPNAGNIDGQATYVIQVARQAIMIVYDGTQWEIL